MPTYDRSISFLNDWDKLSPEQQQAFAIAVLLFVQDLRVGSFRPNLRVKRVRGSRGVWEMTWAADGRATFEYGPELHPGQPHVVWRRVGTHSIFKRP